MVDNTKELFLEDHPAAGGSRKKPKALESDAYNNVPELLKGPVHGVQLANFRLHVKRLKQEVVETDSAIA